MTLYTEYQGEVLTRLTKGVADHNPEYAVSERMPLYIHIPAHYARKESALQAATSYWLKKINQARTKLSELNSERIKCLLSTDPYPSPAEKTTELAVPASVSNVVGSIGGIPSTSGS